MSLGAPLLAPSSYFQSQGEPYWGVQGQTRQVIHRYYEEPLHPVCRQDGTLDPEKMVRFFLKGAKRLKIVK